MYCRGQTKLHDYNVSTFWDFVDYAMNRPDVANTYNQEMLDGLFTAKLAPIAPAGGA